MWVRLVTSLGLALVLGTGQAAVTVLTRIDSVGQTAAEVSLPDGSTVRMDALRRACAHFPQDQVLAYRPASGRCELAAADARIPGQAAPVAGSELGRDETLAANGLVVSMSGPGVLCLPTACTLTGRLRPNPMVGGNGAPPPPPPVAANILSFAVSQASIVSGASVQLDWQAEHVATCQLSASVGGLNATVEAAGSTTLTPDQTTIYTLHCSAPGGFDSRQQVVAVEPAPAQPVVTSFAASPEAVFAGETVNFSWLSSNTTDCQIEGLADGLKPSGQLAFKPAATQTYYLNCFGGGKVDTLKRTVTVSASPTSVSIDTLVAKPAQIAQGSPTELTWRSAAADYCQISSDVDRWQIKVAPSGSTRFTPDRDTRYQLTCFNARSKANATAAVAVTAATGKLRVTAFDASPSRLIRAGQAQLVWTTADADGCRVVDDQGSAPTLVPLNGQAWVHVEKTTTFRAACAARFGQAEDFVTIEVFDETVLAAGFE